MLTNKNQPTLDRLTRTTPSDIAKDNPDARDDSSTRLDELERNLEAASQVIAQQQAAPPAQAAPPPQPTPPRQEIVEESVQSHTETRQFNTFQETVSHMHDIGGTSTRMRTNGSVSPPPHWDSVCVCILSC